MEEWKRIRDYDYEVSTEGRVKNMQTGKILKQYENHSGYLRVRLYKDKKGKYFRVHRLVAEAFIPNPNGFIEVDHLDKNRQNNHVDNLQWINHKEHIRKNHGKMIRCVETGEIYDNIRQASEETDLSYKALSKCLTGGSKTCGGMHWEYV